MTYSVAVIQNETELLRYSYADIRRTTPGFNYLWSYYTAENIDSLHHDLGTFDALILATNSCNDVKIRTWLDRNADRIKCLVEDKVLGLMVLFQMALSDERSTGPYTFLPDLWEATSIKRVQPNAPGDLQRGPHAHCSQVLRFPNTVDIRDLETACLHNSNVPGLRWGYLSRFSPSLYTVLLYEQAEDDDVPLLLSSEGSDQPRIVLSTLVLDWQKHDALLENCLRYVVEGESPCLVSQNEQPFTL